MYTDRIPLDLAKELESKGFIAEIGPDDWDVVEAEWKTKESCYSTYADVFDWLIEEKGIYISICHRYTSVGLEWYPMVNNLCPRAIDGREWNHSANIAISNALEIIRENQGGNEMKIEIKKAQELFREFLIARMNSDLDTTREMIKREHPYWIFEFGQRLLEEAKKDIKEETK